MVEERRRRLERNVDILSLNFPLPLFSIRQEHSSEVTVGRAICCADGKVHLVVIQGGRDFLRGYEVANILFMATRLPGTGHNA